MVYVYSIIIILYLLYFIQKFKPRGTMKKAKISKQQVKVKLLEQLLQTKMSKTAAKSLNCAKSRQKPKLAKQPVWIIYMFYFYLFICLLLKF